MSDEERRALARAAGEGDVHAARKLLALVEHGRSKLDDAIDAMEKAARALTALDASTGKHEIKAALVALTDRVKHVQFDPAIGSCVTELLGEIAYAGPQQFLAGARGAFNPESAAHSPSYEQYRRGLLPTACTAECVGTTHVPRAGELVTLDDASAHLAFFGGRGVDYPPAPPARPQEPVQWFRHKDRETAHAIVASREERFHGALCGIGIGQADRVGVGSGFANKCGNCARALRSGRRS